MKKKFKLLTSIASLGLAIALMAFGVYAATNASVKVTSTVRYNVGSTVIASIEAGREAQNSAAVAHVTSLAALENGVFTGAETEGTQKEDTLGAVTLDPTKTVAVYTFKITNNNKDTETKLSVEVSCAEVNGYSISYKDAATAEITASGDATISVVLTKIDPTVSDANALNVEITISLVQIAA